MDRIFGLITDTMMYRVGSPVPVPPGYPIEPFIVVGILMVEENENDDVAPDAEPTPPPTPEVESEPVEQSVEETEESSVKFLVLAVPDPDELEKGLMIEDCPQGQDPDQWVRDSCPQGQDPELWKLAVAYNRDAIKHESEGRRFVLTVDPAIVVRVERLVGINEFNEIISRATGSASSDGAQETDAT